MSDDRLPVFDRPTKIVGELLTMKPNFDRPVAYGIGKKNYVGRRIFGVTTNAGLPKIRRRSGFEVEKDHG